MGQLNGSFTDLAEQTQSNALLSMAYEDVLNKLHLQRCSHTLVAIVVNMVSYGRSTWALALGSSLGGDIT